MRFLSFLAVSGLLTSAAFAAPALDARQEPGQLNKWCSKFNKACVATCLIGAAPGSTNKVTLACQASGNNYKFGCKCGNTDKTSAALNKAGGLKGVTTTVGTSTKKLSTTTNPVVTSTTLTTTTGSTTYTLSHSETTTSTSTSTESYSTTTTSLSVVPTTWVSTVIKTIPYVSEVTVTQTSASVAGQPVATTVPFPIIEVAFAPPKLRLKTSVKSRADADVFCTNYYNACARQCSRVKSTPRTQVCQKTKTMDYSYRLGCVCKNGITETQHSLADIQEDLDITRTIATVTSTATITKPLTTVQTVTGYSTLTFLTEKTDSFTTTTTTTTSPTSTSTSYTTFSPGTTTSTTSYTPVATHTSTSTILQILAPTGVLNVRRVWDDVSLGYADTETSGSGFDTQINTLSNAKDTADTWMLVKDNSGSGLYRIMSTDASAIQHPYMGCELAQSGAGDFSSSSANYCVMEGTLDALTAAGAAAGQGNFFNRGYESFIWKPTIGTIAGMTGTQLKAYPQWINSDGNTRPTTYMVSGGSNLFLTGNRTALQAAIGSGPKAVNAAPLYLAFEGKTNYA